MKRKNWYLFLGISVISLITLSACGGETKNTASSSINTSTTSSISIPNVIGQDYKKATKLLESKGLKVSTVEKDASEILPNNGWDHAVKKGEVFSVNSVYDKNYDNPSLGTNDVTLEYAKSNYSPKSSENKGNETSDISSSEVSKVKKVEEKPAGFNIDLKGTADQEAIHIVSAEEVGNYDVECYEVPMPEDFYATDYPDYQDLTSFVTIFPDSKKYDISMDTDKSVYDKQLTSPMYISELHDNDVKPLNGGGFTYTGGEIELKEGYQIMVLNGSVKFTKK
ncbi:PASTA domain-containing protein [Lactococcus petauri]|uniref:PASTA domain-containing protein n=1 Tax=Lactococcus petauri TaxID=1940789 RepID=A0AAJ2J049_9LACT|nr:PASTA domain-containing protein [Lactococcus petauri]MDT2527159.1 PASTA domain-containing protein [Lactococcus petauri]MDT2541726.1 PASTA domain-containing protein [Lactococcus petauri]MDT2560434.1 PASTA domain-containing protein [Lactococcus petauri]MDT2568984.1 PASTA domain-containing protein [Lactococcus petauri]MDT2587946.1 PASTA domain-containing protein [Lactococcus petauri]